MTSLPAEEHRRQRRLLPRATVGGDAVHAFVFAEDGEQCLRSVSSYESGKFALDIT